MEAQLKEARAVIRALLRVLDNFPTASIDLLGDELYNRSKKALRSPPKPRAKKTP